MNPFLHLNGVDKSHGATRALSGVDLAVGPDELLVVLGPTGAGKTTLLRVMAGLDSADVGTVLMDGIDVTDWEPAARDVAFVFQHFALYPDWSVRRNLAFPLRAPGRNLGNEKSPIECSGRLNCYTFRHCWSARHSGCLGEKCSALPSVAVSCVGRASFYSMSL